MANFKHAYTMVIRFITILFFSLLTGNLCGQSIPSFWMNIYGLDNYFETKKGEINKITVNKIGYYSSGETYKEKWIYSYISPGRIQGEKYEDNELQMKFQYELDSLNRIVKEFTESKIPLMGWRKEIVVFEYADNKVIFEKRYNENNLISTAKYDYDNLNNPIKLSLYNSKGQLSSYETADYDYNKSTYLYKVFDSNDVMSLQETNFCNIVAAKNLKNEQGDLVQIIWPTASPDENVYHSFEYEYDNQGNWIKRKRFVLENKEKSKHSIINRKIEYR